MELAAWGLLQGSKLCPMISLQTATLIVTYYDLTGLTYGATYKVYVVAMGAHGSSLPSYTLMFHLYYSPPGASSSGIGFILGL